MSRAITPSGAGRSLMWKCGKCNESVDDDFSVCWSCGTSQEGVEDPTFQRAAEDIAAAELESSSQTLTCPKCSSMKIVPRVRIMDRGHYSTDAGDLTVVFYDS